MELSAAPGGAGSFVAGPLLSGVGGNQNDTLGPAAPVAGGIIYANGTPLWTQLAASTNGFVLTLVAGFPAWVAPAGGGWTDDGTVVRLTTVTDQVGIGTASPSANVKLELVGTGAGSLGALYITAGDAIGQYIVLDAGAGAAAYLTFRGNAPAAMAMGALFTAGTPTDYIFTNPSGDTMIGINVAARSLRWYEPIGAGTNYVSFAAPAALAASTDYLLPVAFPPSVPLALISDTAGNLSWGSLAAAGGWTDSGTVVALTTSTDQVGIGTAAPDALTELSVYAQGPTWKPLIVRGAALQSATLAEFQSSAGTPFFSVGPPTLPASGDPYAHGASWLNVTGTFKAAGSAAQFGVNLNLTTAGSASFGLYGLGVYMGPGYTGSSGVYAAFLENGTAGTGANEIAAVANMGFRAQCEGVTAGVNVGVYGNAYASSTRNYGGIVRAADSTNSAPVNIGFAAFALNGSTTNLGGFFGLMAAIPTFASAALMADNGATTSDIFVARDNGTERFVIEDGGTVDISGIAAGTPNFRVTATSDAPVTTWTAGVPSTDPAGFIEITVAGNTRYIPFWT